MRPRNTDAIDQITARNKHGVSVFSRRKSRKITELSELTNSELSFSRAYAATLKAVGYSWRYISDTLNIQTSLVKSWADDDDWQQMVAKVSTDIVSGAVTHLERQAVELTEMLVELARRTTDDAVKLRAIEAGLDRVGMSKVNKSESKVTKDEHTRHEHAMNDEFLQRLEGMPVETQTAVAQLAAQMDELLAKGATQG